MRIRFEYCVAAVFLVGVGACQSPSPHDPRRFLSVRDFEQQGYELAMEWLRRRSGPEIVDVLRAGRAVVRFRLVFHETGETFESNTSTGILVDGGRHLLVAGHALDLVKDHPDARVEVVMASGRVIRGALPAIRGGIDGAPAGDWGCVSLESSSGVDLEWLPMTDGVQGSMVVVFGFPGELGVDANGVVRWDDPGSNPPLEPLFLIGRLVDVASGRVDILAGSQPIGGISGGAIVDLEGRPLAVQVSTSVERNAVKNTESMWFTGTPTSNFRAFLAAAWVGEDTQTRLPR